MPLSYSALRCYLIHVHLRSSIQTRSLTPLGCCIPISLPLQKLLRIELFIFYTMLIILCALLSLVAILFLPCIIIMSLLHLLFTLFFIFFYAFIIAFIMILYIYAIHMMHYLVSHSSIALSRMTFIHASNSSWHACFPIFKVLNAIERYATVTQGCIKMLLQDCYGGAIHFFWIGHMKKWMWWRCYKLKICFMR